jgi:hypothetical protein
MPLHVIIDGNNLLYTAYTHAPLPHIGRETLVRIIERWAEQGDDDVTLVFDGPVPRKGLAKQMASSRITVRFSAPATADDVIVSLVHRASDPGAVRVITSDTAIRREARYKRCACTDGVSFMAELFPVQVEVKSALPPASEKPQGLSPEEAQEWLDMFGVGGDDGEPFDHHEDVTDQ